MISNNFNKRHLGPRPAETRKMLKAVGANTMEELIDQTIPAAIRVEKEPDLNEGMSESDYLKKIWEIGSKNQVCRSYIGLGYYNTFLPPVIQRNVLENPGWYTSYTPYQAEISQGRLEALLNFQTMISDMTGLPMANASLLDEGTAAAEAMIMAFNCRSRDAIKKGINKFFISDGLFPQTSDVIRTRAVPLGIEVVAGSASDTSIGEEFFGGIVQYPDQFGNIHDYKEFIEKMHLGGGMVIVAADLLSLALLSPPGEWGADVAVGSSQRFGIPMGYGGPHAAYFATKEEFKRHLPGRIIGISKDASGSKAYRMALQTREQHIKRERATSNICTAQALLASMAGFYAAYHGPEGLKEIATDIHKQTVVLGERLGKMGYRQINQYFFDTLRIGMPYGITLGMIKKEAEDNFINFRYIEDGTIGISLDETVSPEDLNAILQIFAQLADQPIEPVDKVTIEGTQANIPKDLIRTGDFLQAACFNNYHSETEMMRYMKRLENRDLALNRTMIPLGSCTMKLNAASELISLSWPEFGNIHPFAPISQVNGYRELIKDLEKDLCEVTGYHAISFQPNSGAAGEYTGLLVIRQYHISRGDHHRNICLIPASAHGTNPASSVMAGMKVVVVKTDQQGNIDLDDIRQKAEEHSDNLAAAMITYPSTHGVFEESIMKVIELIHNHGGQVYLDGANMNAQVGYTNPAKIGADVCHLNLHKTFAIPHGGGGPGVGPIGVAAHLAPFLPGHSFVQTGGDKAISAVSSAPFGSASILPISYAYIKMLGRKGLKEATAVAILNANYLKVRLEPYYKILYTGAKGRVAHEMILDCNEFHKTADITVIDIAKRLMDYGFHAPTVAFPVHGTLMVEPTESESLQELDRFCDAMINIREEIREIEDGSADRQNNVLKNAPHTLEMIGSDNWNLPYSREKAAFPLADAKVDKYFTPVTRIDDAFGDRNLVCTCNPISQYVEN